MTAARPRPTGAAGGGQAVQLGSWRWPGAAERHPVLLVPVGSCEQHGPHLPLDTDTRIAVAVAEAAAAQRPDELVVAPPIAIGASGEHQAFPGTLSIGESALELVAVELVRSADHFTGVVFVNGHGGNARALRGARERSTADGRRVAVWHAAVAGGDAHAGRTETSLLLALAPDLVDLDAAVAGNTTPVADLLDELVRHGVGPVSPNGVLGDPAGASTSEGSRALSALVASLLDAVATARSTWSGRA